MKRREILHQIALAESGTATIEFSLLLPVLVVLLIGTIDYAVFLKQRMTLIHGAAAGGAYATLPGKSADRAGINATVLAATSTLQNVTIDSSAFWTCATNSAHVDSHSTCPDGKTPHQWAEVDLVVVVPATFAFPGLDPELTLHANVINPVPWRP